MIGRGAKEPEYQDVKDRWADIRALFSQREMQDAINRHAKALADQIDADWLNAIKGPVHEIKSKKR